MNLFVEYYSHDNNLRKNEIDLSILKNLSFDFIKNYYIFCEKTHIQECEKLIKDNPKVKIILVDTRCTFQYIFNYSNRINLNNENINITLNNDIELTESFRNIKIDKNDFLCLTRWESLQDRHPFNFKSGNSQDTWVWVGINRIKDCDFYFGILGCDNKLAYLAKNENYNVTNPSYKYKTKHNHKSNIREGSKNNTLRIPNPYFMVEPI